MEPQSDQSYHPTLSEHISNTTSTSKKRYELDIDSHDNKRLHDGEGMTWASKDWCVDAINSRKLLREQATGGTGTTSNINSNNIDDTPGSTTDFDNKWYDELNNVTTTNSITNNEDSEGKLYRIEKRSDILNKRTRSRSRTSSSRRPSSYEGMSKDREVNDTESKLSEDHHSRHSGGGEERSSRHSGERSSVGTTSYYSRSKSPSATNNNYNSRERIRRSNRPPPPDNNIEEELNDSIIHRINTKQTSNLHHHHKERRSRSRTPGPSPQSQQSDSKSVYSTNNKSVYSSTNKSVYSSKSNHSTQQQQQQHNGDSKSVYSTTSKKRLGCLGGSTDMTRQRKGREEESRSSRRDDMKSYEHEMKSRRTNSSRGRPTKQDGDRDEGRDGNDRGMSRGRSVSGRSVVSGKSSVGGRSQSRGADHHQERRSQSRGPSQRSQSRGPQAQRSRSRGPQTQRSQSRGPQAQRSQSRAKSQSRRPRRDNTPGPSSTSNNRRSLSQGRSQSERYKLVSSQATTATSAYNDDYTIDTRLSKRSSTNKSISTSNTTRRNSRSKSRSKSITSSKQKKKTATASSKGTVLSHSSSSTHETQPNTSCSGKSTKGSLLKNQIQASIKTSSVFGSRGRSSSPFNRHYGMPPSKPPQYNTNNNSNRHRSATPNSIRSGDETSTCATPTGINTGMSVISGHSAYSFDSHSHHSSHHGTANRQTDQEEIMTYLFDRKGYCVRHPHVRLRKKKILGGWNVLITNCPDCCMEECGRLSRLRKEQKKKRTTGSEKKDTRKENIFINDEPSQVRRSRSRSRARPSRQEQEYEGSSSHRSNSRQRSKSQSTKKKNESQMVFEFDIKLDDKGDVTSPTSGARSVKSRKSTRSKQSRKSSKSIKTSKSQRSTGGSKSTRSKSKSKSRKSSREEEERKEVIRGTQRGSSQRFIRQGPNLKVAKMPYTDKYNREGKYTGEINEYGQPHGHGTLRYNNGTSHEGLWGEGLSEDMDMNMNRATSSGFSGNWKSHTRTSKMEKEQRKEKELDDLRSFISQSVRSGSVGGGGSSQQGGGSVAHSRVPSQFGSGSSQLQQSQQQHHGAGQVQNMPWSDVNGFSGQYTGEVNSTNVPDGHGLMVYSNGVVEQGIFCNGVYQPTPAAAHQQQGGYGVDNNVTGNHQGEEVGGGGGGGVPSSSMSVWSLKSSPTMAFQAGGHNVLTGQPQQQQHHSSSGGRGAAPSSIHMGGPGRGYNVDRRY